MSRVTPVEIGGIACEACLLIARKRLVKETLPGSVDVKTNIAEHFSGGHGRAAE